MRLFEPRDRDELSPPGAPFLRLAEHAPKDPVKPRPHFGRIPELVQPKPGTAARLLDGILRVGADVRAPSGEGQKTIQMGKDERVETRVPFGERVADGGIPFGADLL